MIRLTSGGSRALALAGQGPPSHRGRYVKKKGDKQLFRWWAQFRASVEDYNEALHSYQQAEDWLSVVKVLLHMGEEKKAVDLVNQTNDPAAAFHVARYMEEGEHIQEAINLYKIAKRFNHGIRLAMQNGMENQMVDLALKSDHDKHLQLQVGEYFEGRGVYEKAVLLYQKGGNFNKAITLCFEAQLFGELRMIAENFTKDTDPKLLNKCGEFFMSHRQFDKAVTVFITGGNYLDALDLCEKHAVHITEDMAEKLTPQKSKDPDQIALRRQALLKLGGCLRDQGKYHLACKKFTQAGDKVSAIRCLLKSRDIEKIVYYTTMTRKKDIYVLTANYLQNLDWHTQPELMKKIILFYTKAKAFEKLSLFYDSCAQVEIDEYRDYVKALGALKEASKFLVKSKKAVNKEAKVRSLSRRINFVETYVRARKQIISSNPDQAVESCLSLVDQPEVEAAIRVGDVYALLTEHYYHKDNMEKAMEMIDAMRARNIMVHPYLDEKVLRTICVACGQDPNFDQKVEEGHGDEIDDGIGEEIEEAEDSYHPQE
eukprot:CAMPEP_0197523546 /NCGR_PEP_ID=MMETSP1318-20131121/8451_1 /TAXON_ID=552666 /ORGANISM="Partenskyella glossopodia, Strain RCC365" /LENGTH=540 /DNA_ID=CAMNT_0043076265 /DNA_START=466 /DNA_END=2089 /DNA_ORIENTATION=-